LDFISEQAEKKAGENFVSLLKLLEKTDRGMKEALDTIEFSTVEIAFAFGFVFGQMFDLGTEKGKKAVETLKEKIIKAGLLLYYPKENKASKGGKTESKKEKGDIGGEVYSILNMAKVGRQTAEISISKIELTPNSELDVEATIGPIMDLFEVIEEKAKGILKAFNQNKKSR
jgi:hypothetical protein